MKKISLKDIALQTGVSPTTVSFVLNGKGREKRISEEVIVRIEKLIKELDYKPNQIARGLRTGKTRTLGLMVEDISNRFFATLAKVIEDEADRHGYDVLYCSTEAREERAKKLLRMLRNRQVDGFILTPTTDLEKDIQVLLREKRPLVLVDRYFPNLQTHYVVLDNFKGSYTGTSCLLEQGYQRIAAVTTYSSQMQMQQRLEGYRKALISHGIAHDNNWELYISFEKKGQNAINQIRHFLMRERPDAVFFFTNYLAVYGLEAIKELGWSLSSQIGLISFDDHPLFRLYEPSITCIAQPVEEMGKKVIEILMNEVNNPGQKEYTQHVLSPKLLARESCREKLKIDQLNIK